MITLIWMIIGLFGSIIINSMTDDPRITYVLLGVAIGSCVTIVTTMIDKSIREV